MLPAAGGQAGKTGTIDSNEAVWFAGYTPQVAGAAMIASTTDKQTWKGDYRKRGEGLHRAVDRTYLEGSGSGDAGRRSGSRR